MSNVIDFKKWKQATLAGGTPAILTPRLRRGRKGIHGSDLTEELRRLLYEE